MTRNWLITVSTKQRDGTEKISTSPMLCTEEISEQEAIAVAVSQFGADRVISVRAK